MKGYLERIKGCVCLVLLWTFPKILFLPIIIKKRKEKKQNTHTKKACPKVERYLVGVCEQTPCVLCMRVFMRLFFVCAVCVRCACCGEVHTRKDSRGCVWPVCYSCLLLFLPYLASKGVPYGTMQNCKTGHH